MSEIREMVLMWMVDAAKELRSRAMKCRDAYPGHGWGVPAAEAYDEAASVIERHADEYRDLHAARLRRVSP